MNVEQWKEVFINAGSLIIGLILACGQLYTVWQMKKADKEKAKSKEPKNYGKQIKAENAHTVKIQEEIEELRQALNADRVQVLEFHNGTDFSTRKGYKMDCTYETIRYGNETAKGILQNYPTTLLPIFMSKIIDNKQYFVSDVNQLMNVDMSTYAMKMNMHVGSFYDVSLEDKEDVIGILAVQYAEPRILNEEQKAILHAKKIVIEELLKL